MSNSTSAVSHNLISFMLPCFHLPRANSGKHTHVDPGARKVPQHLDEVVWERVEVHVELPVLNVVFGVRVLALVVMDHLHDLQQVILTKLGEGLGKLLHVNVAGGRLALLLGCGCGTVGGTIAGGGDGA